MKKKDVILIAALLLIALVSYLGIQKWQGSRTAVVTRPVGQETTEAMSEQAETKEEQTEKEQPVQAQTEAVQPVEAATEVTTEAAREAVTAATETVEAGSERPSAQEAAQETTQAPAVTGHYGIRIYADGEELGVYSLEEDQIIQIGETNTVEIKGGGATMIDAKCPDQLCRYMGTIYDAYGLIVCLPNGVIVEGVNLSPEPDEVQIDGLS